MGQPTYTEKFLSKMGMNNCKPVSTPADQLVKEVYVDEEAKLGPWEFSRRAYNYHGRQSVVYCDG